MANPLEAWEQHAIASEHMDLTGVGSHQKKGWNFAQNFPALVPGTGVGPAQWVGPTLATGYQLGQEGLKSILPEKWGGTGIGFVDAMKKGWTEAKQNIEGMGGKGFDKDKYDEWMHAQGYAPEYDFSGIAGQTAGLNIPLALKAYLKNRMKYGAVTTAANLALEAKAKAAEKKAAEEKAAADRKAQQQKTIAARGTAQGSGGTFVDRKTGAMKGYEKGAGGGKDAPSQHFYIARGGLAQRAPRYANGGLINFYRYGGYLG
jgi:hypothetical protein